MSKIPFNKPPFLGSEFEYMREAINSGHISGDGGFTKRCSAALEGLIGAQKVLLTTSCTHALEMAALLLRLHRITPDDRYRDTAARLLRFLKSTQNCESVDPGLRGGIKGAFPFDQLYGRFQVLNYSTASFVEALLRYTFTLP